MIHQPSVARKVTIGAMSSIFVNWSPAARDLWKATRSGVSWP
ncbi:hypothetical protein ACFFVH_21290 [Streptomyces echinatus]